MIGEIQLSSCPVLQKAATVLSILASSYSYPVGAEKASSQPAFCFSEAASFHCADKARAFLTGGFLIFVYNYREGWITVDLCKEMLQRPTGTGS